MEKTSSLGSGVRRPPSLSRVDWVALLLLLAVTAVKGVLWSVAVPLWQGPDENRHFATVQFIAERGRLPGPEDVYRDDENVIAGELADVARLWYAPEQRQAFATGTAGPREAEIQALDRGLRTRTDRLALNIANHLAPLSYLLSLPLYGMAAQSSLLDRVFLVRQLSVLCTVGTVAASYFLAREVFPRRRAAWITVSVLVSFQPMLTFVGAVVNSDALLCTLYTLLLYLTVRTLTRGWGYGSAAAAGAIAGLGMLTKPLIAGALPVLGLAVLWDAWRRRRWRALPGTIALSGGLALAVCGWWLWRSLRLFGALFYANPTAFGAMPVAHPYHDYTLLRYSWHYLQSLVGGVFCTYWADFGWIDTPLPQWVYWLLLAVCTLAVLGGAAYLIRTWRRQRSGARAERTEALAVGALAAHAAALTAMIGYNTYRTWVLDGIGWGGMQGRYYLGAVAGAMAFLLAGLLAVAPARWEPALHVALRWGMIAFNVVCLFFALVPRYYL